MAGGAAPASAANPTSPAAGPTAGWAGRAATSPCRVPHENTLLPLRYHTELRAERGHHGGPGNRTGRGGSDLLIRVPPGHRSPDEATGMRCSARFSRRATSSAWPARRPRGPRQPRVPFEPNRAPREAEPGEPGEERWLRLDLPSSPTSACWALPTRGSRPSSLASARPAPRSATTRSPPCTRCSGWCESTTALRAADIPGIIEGAHDGAGLGLHFLRHVERTRALVHVVDASGHERPRCRLPTSHDVLAEVRPWTPPSSNGPSSSPPPSATRLTDPDPLPALVEMAAAAVSGASRLGGDGPGARRS